MHGIIKAPTASRLYAAVLDNVLGAAESDSVGPRGMPTYELRNQVYVLTDPARCAAWLPGRRLNYPFMFAEFLWVFCGRSDVAMISYYNANIAKFSDDGQAFYGAYGPRWRGQVGGVLERIRKDVDTRQAIIGVWRPEYNIQQHDLADGSWAQGDEASAWVNPHYTTTKDAPCTLTMHYMVRGGALEATVSMRSSDAWLGLPYDIFNFAMLQRAVAAELQLWSGPLTLFIGSSHIYERDIEHANRILEANDATVEVVVPGPPGVGQHEVIAAAEYALRMGGASSIPDGWQAFATMLEYRRLRNLDRVDPRLAPLLMDVPA